MPYDLYAQLEVGGPHWRAVGETLWMNWSLDSMALFGLGKRRVAPPLFGDRGVPADCSERVQAIVERNRTFIDRYGEGDSGHTWALWSELSPLVAGDEELQTGALRLLFVAIAAQEACGLSPEQIRVVAWGNG